MGLYTNMLQKACEAYAEGYYENNFQELQKIEYGKITKNWFLEKLNVDSDSIRAGNNLGEIKTYILLQMLWLMLGKRLYQIMA